MRPEVQSWPDRHPLGNIDNLQQGYGVYSREHDMVFDPSKTKKLYILGSVHEQLGAEYTCLHSSGAPTSTALRFRSQEPQHQPMVPANAKTSDGIPTYTAIAGSTPTRKVELVPRYALSDGKNFGQKCFLSIYRLQHYTAGNSVLPIG